MKNVVLIGLGAVGLTYAVKLKNKCNLRILADNERLERFKKLPPMLNGSTQIFDYILPSDNFDADLIIISTKSDGLNDALFAIRNFVKSGTIIISLINGVFSEDIIKQEYPDAVVLKSYFIGHSAVRQENKVTQDGIGEIVIEENLKIKDFFTYAGINYSMPKDINYSMWLKYTLNLFSNPTSAILNMTFGELKHNNNFKKFAKNIIKEVKQIANIKGIKNLENLEENALDALKKMSDDGKTSMLQDIQAKKPTEIDIFSGEIVKLGKLYNIPTPYNQVLYELVKIKEEENEYSVHSGEGRK